MKMKSNLQSSNAAAQASEASISSGPNLDSFAQPELRASEEPSEARIREYAYTLYEKANCCDGHDIDHWFDAVAHLRLPQSDHSRPLATALAADARINAPKRKK